MKLLDNLKWNDQGKHSTLTPGYYTPEMTYNQRMTLDKDPRNANPTCARGVHLATEAGRSQTSSG